MINLYKPDGAWKSKCGNSYSVVSKTRAESKKLMSEGWSLTLDDALSKVSAKQSKQKSKSKKDDQ